MATSAQPQRNILQRSIGKLDAFQQAHAFIGFPYAVIKKYGDDQAGYHTALLTYYAFLSLFPLLLVATSVTQLVVRHNTALQSKVIHALTSRFPLFGDQLQQSIHSSNKTGVALIIGLILTYYGAKGVADAFQSVLNSLWQVPKSSRSGFPKAPLKSLALLSVGSVGLILSTVLSGYATGYGKSIVFGVTAFIIGYFVTTLTLIGIIKLGLSIKTTNRKNRVGF